MNDEHGLSERQMFGGLCFLAYGNMCFGIIGTEIMVRVGPDAHDAALSAPNAREMDFTGRSMRGMVYVDEAGISEEHTRCMAATSPALRPVTSSKTLTLTTVTQTNACGRCSNGQRPQVATRCSFPHSSAPGPTGSRGSGSLYWLAETDQNKAALRSLFELRDIPNQRPGRPPHRPNRPRGDAANRWIKTTPGKAGSHTLGKAIRVCGKQKLSCRARFSPGPCS